MRTIDTHVYFWGSFLSNFRYCPIRLEVLMLVRDALQADDTVD